MADLILKNNAGKIWVNGDGKVLKAKQFSEIPIQDGLAFWGKADPALLTTVDGLISEAYDVRDGYGGARKMIQNTAINRPEYINNSIRSTVINTTTGHQSLSMASQNIRNMFICLKVISATVYINGISVAYNAGLIAPGLGQSGGNKFGFPLNNGIEWQDSYINNNKLDNTYYTGVLNTIYIQSTLTDVKYINSPIYIGAGRTSTTPSIVEIYEWGWYNRVLSETEVIYNINCLNQKYSIY